MVKVLALLTISLFILRFADSKELSHAVMTQQDVIIALDSLFRTIPRILSGSLVRSEKTKHTAISETDVMSALDKMFKDLPDMLTSGNPIPGGLSTRSVQGDEESLAKAATSSLASLLYQLPLILGDENAGSPGRRSKEITEEDVMDSFKHFLRILPNVLSGSPDTLQNVPSASTIRRALHLGGNLKAIDAAVRSGINLSKVIPRDVGPIDEVPYANSIADVRNALRAGVDLRSVDEALRAGYNLEELIKKVNIKNLRSQHRRGDRRSKQHTFSRNPNYLSAQKHRQ